LAARHCRENAKEKPKEREPNHAAKVGKPFNFQKIGNFRLISFPTFALIFISGAFGCGVGISFLKLIYSRKDAKYAKYAKCRVFFAALAPLRDMVLIA
jgi:hypothetical protein